MTERSLHTGGLDRPKKVEVMGEHADDIIETTELVPVQSSGNDLLALLVQKDASMEMIEKFMDLRDREEARDAKKAYTEAMAKFKENPPEIEKDNTVSYKTDKGEVVTYDHATLGNVTNTINKALGVQGLSAAWGTAQGEGGVTVTCTITHISGHSESTSLKAAPDTSGKKNPIQSLGSTISYLERYTILALTGLATKDMDNDGQGEVEYVNEKQAKEINDFLGVVGREKDFLTFMNSESVELIPADKFSKAIKTLKATVKKMDEGDDN